MLIAINSYMRLLYQMYWEILLVHKLPPTNFYSIEKKNRFFTRLNEKNIKTNNNNKKKKNTNKYEL